MVLLVYLALSGVLCFGQKHLLSYDDLKLVLINNLQKTDTFMVAKGYQITAKNDKKNTRSYSSVSGSSHVNVDVRLDGKRLFIEIITNELSQYDMVHNSIAQYVLKDAPVGDVQTYEVKQFGSIYITVNDTMPYDPLKREYDIHIVSDKHITAYN